MTRRPQHFRLIVISNNVLNSSIDVRVPTTANLLVVNLHVPAYKVVGDGSRKILCWARYANPEASRTRRVQPGRYD